MAFIISDTIDYAIPLSDHYYIYTNSAQDNEMLVNVSDEEIKYLNSIMYEGSLLSYGDIKKVASAYMNADFFESVTIKKFEKERADKYKNGDILAAGCGMIETFCFLI